MHESSKPAALTIKLSSDSGSSNLKVGFENEMGADLVEHPSNALTPNYLERELVEIRRKMTEWSKAYDSLLINPKESSLLCDPERTKEIWRDFAVWGRRIYRKLFDTQANNSRDLSAWAQDLKEEPFCGNRIIIDSAVGDIPWGLLYDEEVPESYDRDYQREMLDHFWITKYELEVLPPYPRNRFRWRPQLSNREATRLTVTVNKSVEGDYGAQHLSFFQELASRLNHNDPESSPSLRLNCQKQEVIDSISQCQEPQHLLYFFCHHHKGGGKWTTRGWRDFDDTRIVVSGDDDNIESAITIKEMEDNERIKCFNFPPVVFLNACESVQAEMGDPSSFLLYFINILRAYAFIGTEASIPAAFADAFGRRFVEEFLGGTRIGEIMANARRFYARSYDNPFGFYYALYGNGNVRLSQPAY
jgi:hypothetical protein